MHPVESRSISVSRVGAVASVVFVVVWTLACDAGAPASTGTEESGAGGSAAEVSSSGAGSSGNVSTGSTGAAPGVSAGIAIGAPDLSDDASPPADDSSALSPQPAPPPAIDDSGLVSAIDADGAQPVTSSSDSGSNLGPGPPGCPDPLGSVWTVTEAGNGCTSTWSRQGTSSTFDDRQGAPCNVSATVTVTLTGTNVSAFWITSSDNDDCNYVGMLNATCTMIVGDYTCTTGDAGSGNWSVAIR